MTERKIPKEDVETLPGKLQGIVSGLLELGFTITYRCGSPADPRKSEPPKGRIDARTEDVHLYVTLNWRRSKPEGYVNYYLWESVGDRPPGLSKLGRRNFWRIAKGEPRRG